MSNSTKYFYIHLKTFKCRDPRTTETLPKSSNSVCTTSNYNSANSDDDKYIHSTSNEDKNEILTYSVENSDCKIDSRSWKSCRFCRFNRCIACGMRPGT